MNKSKTDRTEKKNKHICNYTWGFNIPLSTSAKTTREKISRATEEENINQQDLMNIHSIFHLKTSEYAYIHFKCLRQIY